MGKEKIILTGDRPTGRLHIGHYVGSLKPEYDDLGTIIKTAWKWHSTHPNGYNK